MCQNIRILAMWKTHHFNIDILLQCYKVSWNDNTSRIHVIWQAHTCRCLPTGVFYSCLICGILKYAWGWISCAPTLDGRYRQHASDVRCSFFSQIIKIDALHYRDVTCTRGWKFRPFMCGTGIWRVNFCAMNIVYWNIVIFVAGKEGCQT